MGFLRTIAGVGKKVLGGVVNAGRAVQTLRDKAVNAFNKVKDSLPGPLKSALDTGIEYVMNTPVGSAIKKASGLLDTGVSMADAAHKKISEYEAQGGPPAAAQLQAIGERASPGGSVGDDNGQQERRLAALKRE